MQLDAPLSGGERGWKREREGGESERGEREMGGGERGGGGKREGERDVVALCTHVEASGA